MIELQIKCLSTVLWPVSVCVEALRVLNVLYTAKKHGQTPLIVAARHSKDNIFYTENTVKFLIEIGVHINFQDNDGWTALMQAAGNTSFGSTENTVSILLNSGANIDLQSNWMMTTALMMAVKYSRIYSTENTVKILLNAGANTNLHDNRGITALMYAVLYSASWSTKNTVKMLINGLVFEYMDACPIII